MRVYQELSANEFEFWGGAVQTVNILSENELNTIWEYLEEIAPEEGMDATEINDFVWFEDEIIADILGWPSYEDLWDARNNKDNVWFDTFDEWEAYQQEHQEEEEEEERIKYK